MVLLQIGAQKVDCDALLFDKDGTLLDFMQLWGSWAERMLVQIEDYLQSTDHFFTGKREQVFGTQYNAQGELINYDRCGPLAMASVEESTAILAWQLYAAGTSWDQAIVHIRQFSQIAMEQMEQERPVQPMPGLLPFLEQCRAAHLPLAVVTADWTSEAVKHLRWSGLDIYFDHIIGSDEVQQSKPAPDLIYTACGRLGIEANRTILIGDSNADMQMGRNADVICCIGISTVSESADIALPDAHTVITHYDQLQVLSSPNHSDL